MNYTLITGASKGIGKALAEEFARYGLNLILVARSIDKLDSIASQLTESYRVDVKVFPADLTDLNAAMDLYEWCRLNKYYVRILVNNAGYGLYGSFLEADLGEQLEMINLNQLASMRLIHLFGPAMFNLPNPHILNVASTAAFQPVPYMSSYSASKSFIVKFTLGLRKELRKSGINVSCLCPGPTITDFYQTAGLHKSGLTDNKSVLMPPELVASQSLKQLFNKKALIIPGTSNQMGYMMSKFLPVSWITAMIYGIFKPSGKDKLKAPPEKKLRE